MSGMHTVYPCKNIKGPADFFLTLKCYFISAVAFIVCFYRMVKLL